MPKRSPDLQAEYDSGKKAEKWKCHECKLWTLRKLDICPAVLEDREWSIGIQYMGIGPYAKAGKKHHPCQHQRCMKCETTWR